MQTMENTDPSYRKERIDTPLYYHSSYAGIQQYARTHHFQDSQFSIVLAIEDHVAISLPKSPIGGFFHNLGSLDSFLHFYDQIEQQLKSEGVQKITIKQAPGFYPGSVPDDWLTRAGYRRQVTEISHYLPIEGKLVSRMHSMEVRKLNKSSVDCRLDPLDQADEVHEFISRCRAQQNLQINISVEKLQLLIEAFPDRYQLFSAYENDQRIAAIIMVAPTDKIAYYYLPATDQAFKSQSPMVPLLAYVYSHYQNKGFQAIDLGISSIDGEPQHSLIHFKENMGGVASNLNIFQRQLL